MGDNLGAFPIHFRKLNTNSVFLFGQSRQLEVAFFPLKGTLKVFERAPTPQRIIPRPTASWPSMARPRPETHELTANLLTKILDFRGLDSSIILILRGGILMSVWNFPESLSQILVGKFLREIELSVVSRFLCFLWPFVLRLALPFHYASMRMLCVFTYALGESSCCAALL